MKFIITQTDLKKLAARANAVTQEKPTIPVLGCVILDARPDGIYVLAGAGTGEKPLVYESRLSTNVVAPGIVAIPAKSLLDTAKNLPTGAVTVTIPKDGKVQFEAGKTKVTLPTHTESEFPRPAAEKGGTTVTVKGSDLALGLERVRASVAPPDNKYGLGGVFMDPMADGIVRLVTTDGNRLTWAAVKFSDTVAKTKLLIPGTTIPEFIRLATDAGDNDVSLTFLARSITASVGDERLNTRLLEADFPDYRQVLPKQFQRTALIDREELTEVVRRVSAFATDGARTTTLSFAEDGTLTIKASGFDYGDAIDEVTADLAGEPMTISFNGRYLIDALDAISGGRVKFRMGDVLSPCIITDLNDAGAEFVVMPVRA